MRLTAKSRSRGSDALVTCSPSSPHLHSWLALPRLGDVQRRDGVCTSEVGDGARQLEDIVEGAGGESQALGGGARQRLM